MALNLSSLNPEQRAAVTHPGGPLLVLAGAGSGKTRVIASRVAWLAGAGGVPPERILAVTFTNKAAREMAERVAELLGGAGKSAPDHRPTVCTFHAFGVRMLRVHAGLLGYRSGFVIFDTQDQLSLVRSLMEEGDFDTVLLPPKNAVYALGHAKGRGLTAAQVLESGADPARVQLARLLEQYQHALQRMNAMDFEDLLQLALRLTRKHAQESRQFFSRYAHVLVDEYQDTNPAQYELLRALVSGHMNLCVVGDDDQSIYGWRGAAPGNIRDFEHDFAGARVVRLEHNYRSTDAILSAANQVIAHNRLRRDKRLHGLQGPGRLLEWISGDDERDELEKVVTHLKLSRLRSGGPWGDYAILFRANHQSRLIEETLREQGVPYLLVGGTRFYERKEVKDGLAYLRLIANPRDEVSLFRVLNWPRRGIGQTSQLRLAEHAAREGRPCAELLAEAARFPEFSDAVATAMARFADLLVRYRLRFDREPLGPVFKELLAELDFHRAVEKEREDKKGRERARSLVVELEHAVDQFARARAAAGEGAGLKDYLEHVALFTLADQEDASGNQVTLTTVHAAKGLEFPAVYLVHLAEDVFPNHRSLAEDGEEEERRLFYVALTRARGHLVLSMAAVRKRYGQSLRQQPSRFVLEIEPTLFDGAPPHADAATAHASKAAKTQGARSRFFDQVKKMQAGGA